MQTEDIRLPRDEILDRKEMRRNKYVDTTEFRMTEGLSTMIVKWNRGVR